MITVRAVRSGEHEALRELRLRAMADAPEAFGASLDDERARPESEWVALAEGGDDGVMFVAIDDDRWVGLGAGRLDAERGIAHLWSMWVEPAHRGSGLGSRLVIAVRDWAAARGARFVRLGVVGTSSAMAFYERLGFVDTGERKPLRRDPSLIAVYMVRPA